VVKDKLPAARVVLSSRGTTPGRQPVLKRPHQLLDRHGLRACTVHQLRHAFCTGLLRGGADIETVRLVAGHTDLKTPCAGYLLLLRMIVQVFAGHKTSMIR